VPREGRDPSASAVDLTVMVRLFVRNAAHQILDVLDHFSRVSTIIILINFSQIFGILVSLCLE
jgi:hypothetical protein